MPPRCVLPRASPRLATLHAWEPAPPPSRTPSATVPRPGAAQGSGLGPLPPYRRLSPSEPLLGEQSRRAARRAASPHMPRPSRPQTPAPARPILCLPDSRLGGWEGFRKKLWATYPGTRQARLPGPGALRTRGRGHGLCASSPELRRIPAGARSPVRRTRLPATRPGAAGTRSGGWSSGPPGSEDERAREKGLRIAAGKVQLGDSWGIGTALTSRAGALRGLHAARGVTRPWRPCSCGCDSALDPGAAHRAAAGGPRRRGGGGCRGKRGRVGDKSLSLSGPH